MPVYCYLLFCSIFLQTTRNVYHTIKLECEQLCPCLFTSWYLRIQRFASRGSRIDRQCFAKWLVFCLCGFTILFIANFARFYWHHRALEVFMHWIACIRSGLYCHKTGHLLNKHSNYCLYFLQLLILEYFALI